MRWKGYSTHCVCVFLISVYYIATKSAAFLVLRRKQGIVGFFMVFSRFLSHVAFAGNAAFLTLWHTFDDKRDSNGLILSTRIVCVAR